MTISPYTKDDFLKGTKPFEDVYAHKADPFVHDRALEQMTIWAKSVGVNGFKKLYKAYIDSLRIKNKEIMVPNVTQFDGQEMELDSGRWVADEFGIRTDGPYGSDIEACNHPIMPVLRLVNIDTGAEKLQIAYRKGKQWRKVIAEKGVLASANKILELANVGVAVTSESAKHLVQYFYDLESLNYDTVIIRGVETDADVLAMQERLKKLNDEYDRLYGRALIEIEDITDPEVRVAISRRSFDGWSWAEVAQELSPSRDAETVRMVVNRYFKENNSSR